jgi:hypothetical protein
VRGKRVPSDPQVLGLLEDWSAVSPTVLEPARELGKNVHVATHLADRDELDRDALDPALTPYVAGWEKFLAESGAVVIATELRLYHAELGYAGTADRVLDWRGRIVIPDLKTSACVPRTVGAQAAAYAKAYQQLHGGPEPKRYCINLTGDGNYRSHARTDPADWSLFLSALNCWKFKYG